MQGYPIGNSRVRLGGDRSGTTAAAPAKKQFVKPEKPGAGIFKKSLADCREFVSIYVVCINSLNNADHRRT